ncbi:MULTISPECIES: fumarylacetoacetate hydrolase family protein [Paenibacillus]|uniref:fumarylacetoacetate hydrolase family protein n=1 Tax=Paenibacillus TaxID=44249 RepID=UPI0022B8B746|nr:fumarylacetoacetate hydrolase family protein [Paenibacillus caseinilyticus]MCZ8518067.1 fumarylacetoacetate hydrolase family protein [Paenibacillus caseinilyticus]
MNESIRNIYCVGRNYGLHAAELGNDIPEEPMIFTKPTHALTPIDGGEISLPQGRGEVHYEAELVLHVGRAYEPGIAVDELVDRMALGIDFTLRDVQSVIKKKGHPWLPAKGFLNSAALTAFRPFPGFEQVKQVEYTLQRNGEEVQRGNLNDMIFNLQVIIDYIAEHYGLGAGDIIYTGTPAGVAAVREGDRFELLWGDEQLGAFTARFGG